MARSPDGPISAELQGCETEQREDHARNPETDHNLALFPTDKLEVVMHWSHTKDPLACELVRDHLKDHGQGFQHEDTADHGKQKLLLDQDRDGSDGPSEREGTDVSHENLCRMAVVPEESHCGSHHGAAEDG